MSHLKLTMTALTLSVAALTGESRAADPHTVDELAFALMRQTAAATREVRFGFRNAPQYKHLYQDVYDMYRAADHIHDVAHVAGNQRHILKDVEQLDELVHHVQELIDEMSGPAVGHSRHYQYHYGHRPSSQYHMRRLNHLMHDIVETVHELQDVVGYSRPTRPVSPAVIPGIGPRGPQLVPQVPIQRRGGVEYRRGRSRGLSFSIRIP